MSLMCFTSELCFGLFVEFTQLGEVVNVYLLTKKVIVNTLGSAGLQVFWQDNGCR